MHRLIQVDVESLGRGGDRLVEVLGCKLAILKGLFTRFAFGVVVTHIGLVADRARVLVLVIAETVARDGGFAQDYRDAVGGPLDRNRAHPHVAILDLGKKPFPELFLQVLHQFEAGLDQANALASNVRFGQPRRELQILTLGSEGFSGQLDHECEVGLLDCALPLPAGNAVVVFCTRFLDLIVDAVVPQARTRRIIARDRIQQIITQWHFQPSPRRDGRSGSVVAGTAPLHPRTATIFARQALRRTSSPLPRQSRDQDEQHRRDASRKAAIWPATALPRDPAGENRMSYAEWRASRAERAAFWAPPLRSTRRTRKESRYSSPR